MLILLMILIFVDGERGYGCSTSRYIYKKILHNLQVNMKYKGTVSVNLSDLPCKKDNGRFTTASLNLSVFVELKDMCV